MASGPAQLVPKQEANVAINLLVHSIPRNKQTNGWQQNGRCMPYKWYRRQQKRQHFLLPLLYVARYQLTGVRHSKFSLAEVQQLILMFRYLLGCPHQAMINTITKHIKKDECAYI